MVWKYTVRFPQFVINLDTWLRTTNHKNSQLKGMNKWKILTSITYTVTWMGERKTTWSSRVKGGWCEKGWLLSQTEWPMYLRSGWWILNVIYQGQFRQANTNISVWNPKTFYPWFWRHNSAALSITKQSRSSYTWVASCCHVELHLYKKFLPVSENHT